MPVICCRAAASTCSSSVSKKEPVSGPFCGRGAAVGRALLSVDHLTVTVRGALPSMVTKRRWRGAFFPGGRSSRGLTHDLEDVVRRLATSVVGGVSCSSLSASSF
jgi:hypothetical protein